MYNECCHNANANANTLHSSLTPLLCAQVVGGAALGCIVLWLSSGTHMLYNSMGPWDVPLPSHDAAAPSAGWLLRGPLGLSAAIVWLVFMVLLARSPQRGRIQAARVREALEGLGLICGTIEQ